MLGKLILATMEDNCLLEVCRFAFDGRYTVYSIHCVTLAIEMLPNCDLCEEPAFLIKRTISLKKLLQQNERASRFKIDRQVIAWLYRQPKGNA